MGADEPRKVRNAAEAGERFDASADVAPTLDALEFAHDSLAAQERAQDVWADTLRHLVDATSETIDHEISRALVRAGRFAEVDRAYVFQFSPDRRTMILTHEWASPGSLNQSEALAQIDETVLPRFLQRLHAGDEVYVPDISDLGENERIERVVLASHGVVATLLVPMLRQGDLVGFVGFDSTERVRYWNSEHRSTLRFVADVFAGAFARTRLERRNHVLSKTLEQSPTGVAIYSSAGAVEWVNAAFEKMSGHKQEELVDRVSGENPFGLKDPELLNEMLGTVLAGGAWEHELDMANASGRHVVLRMTVFAVDEHDRTASKIVCLLEDVTGRIEARRRLEEAKSHAERASEAKSRFLASMSHEIRTPMNTIIGNIELLDDTPVSPPQRELLDSLDTAGEHLLHIVDEVLDLSRIESGELEVAEEPLDVRVLLDEVVDVTQTEQEKSPASLRTKVASSVPRSVIGDVTLLRQVLVNLACNALKFAPEGLVEIDATVKTNVEDPVLVIRVADTGIGIEPDRLDTIFEPYETHDRPGRGTGLGLSISRQIVEAMGGRIAVDSQVGVGTTFTVSLPLITEADVIVSKSVEAVETDLSVSPTRAQVAEQLRLGASDDGRGSSRIRSDRSLRVLVADDSDDSIRIVEAFLRPIAEAIDHVPNGLDAVEHVRSNVYDIVLMDMQMPIMDGYAATEAIRALDEISASDTPIVALTAYALAEEIGRAISAGCDGYLTKPIRRAELIRTVEKYARSRAL